jgi:hypothetical protein
MTTVVPAISAFPPSPLRSDPSTFAARTEVRLTHDETVFQPEISAVRTAINTLAGELTASAAAAAASAGTAAIQAGIAQNAAATAGATLWVTGTTYAIGDMRISPTDFQPYRRKTAGAGALDPILDSTNWAFSAGLAQIHAAALIF